jgi:hypothetical protein
LFSHPAIQYLKETRTKYLANKEKYPEMFLLHLSEAEAFVNLGTIAEIKDATNQVIISMYTQAVDEFKKAELLHPTAVDGELVEGLKETIAALSVEA